MNKDAQVRFHGKASGLYLLDGIGWDAGRKGRNEGGMRRVFFSFSFVVV